MRKNLRILKTNAGDLYVIILPEEWVSANRLKQGDDVLIFDDTRANRIVVYPPNYPTME